MANDDQPYIDEHPDIAKARRLTSRELLLAIKRSRVGTMWVAPGIAMATNPEGP